MTNSHVNLFMKMYQFYSQQAFVQNILLWAMHILGSEDIIKNIKGLYSKVKKIISLGAGR